MAKDAEIEELVEPVSKTEAKVVVDEGLYESLYNKERQKNKILLLSTGTFLVLFMVAVGFGLQRTDQRHQGPGGRGMYMQGPRGFNNFDGPSGPSYRQ